MKKIFEKKIKKNSLDTFMSCSVYHTSVLRFGLKKTSHPKSYVGLVLYDGTKCKGKQYLRYREKMHFWLEAFFPLFFLGVSLCHKTLLVTGTIRKHFKLHVDTRFDSIAHLLSAPGTLEVHWTNCLNLGISRRCLCLRDTPESTIIIWLS